LSQGRALLGARPLRRDEWAPRGRDDVKWRWGDLALDIPKALLVDFARAVGKNVQELLRYRDVAAAWPAERRVAASWSAHRELQNIDERFDVIAPGMTERHARGVIGKRPSDQKS